MIKQFTSLPYGFAVSGTIGRCVWLWNDGRWAYVSWETSDDGEVFLLIGDGAGLQVT